MTDMVDSGSHSPIDNAASLVSNNSVDRSAKSKASRESDLRAVPFLSLFRGCDRYDYIAIGIGLFGSLANGFTFPVFGILFGEVRCLLC
jgi:hypothetical protein